MENEKEEKYNFTNDLYRIVSNAGHETSDETNLCGNITNSTSCHENYDSIEISVVIVLFLLIVVTVIGNTLIISAVVTTKRLRTVTNCFVTSLAAADLLVGIFVMPPAIAVHITGELKY